MKGEMMRAQMAVSLAALLLMAAMALAADTQVLQGSGDFVVAVFSSTDATGCIITDVSASAGTGMIRQDPGGSSSQVALDVFVAQYDTCRQVQLLAALGTSLNPSFQFARDLSSASALGTVLMSDAVSGTSFNFFADLSWTGFGDSQRIAGSTYFVSPGGTVFVHAFNGLVRPAQASGTISDGTTNFTPQASLSA
jgi:hypothetical protein